MKISFTDGNATAVLTVVLPREFTTGMITDYTGLKTELTSLFNGEKGVSIPTSGYYSGSPTSGIITGIGLDSTGSKINYQLFLGSTYTTKSLPTTASIKTYCRI